MPKLVRTIGVATVVAVLVVVGLSAFAIASPALASGASTVSAHGGRGFCGEAGLAAAADALGLSTDELQTQLRAGESLADLADEAGVDAADVLAAIDDACAQVHRDAIEQAVTDGDLTRDHADWLLEGLDKGYWGPGSDGAGPGFGFGPRGGGHRGPGGPGGFFLPDGRGGLFGPRFETNRPALIPGADS